MGCVYSPPIRVPRRDACPAIGSRARILAVEIPRPEPRVLPPPLSPATHPPPPRVARAPVRSVSRLPTPRPFARSPVITPLQSTVHVLQMFAGRHRRGLVAAAVALLGGFGLTAVATVAISPLVPDPGLLPQRVVTESLETKDLTAQLGALAAQELVLTRSTVTRGTDSAEALLSRLGVVDAAAAAFVRNDATARALLAGRGGKMVQARVSADGALESLVARYPAQRSDDARTRFTRLSIERAAGALSARVESVPFEARTRLASGTIRSTLFAATDEAGIPDAVATQISDIFATDIDFHRELKKGDTFHLVYETLTADGEPVTWNDGVGRVLAAEFVTGGRRYQAVWFAGSDGRGAYFTPDGRSKRRSFLASPMEFSRVTSTFAMRLHPLTHNWRKHNGIDYGAPMGTPVRVVGDGVVEYAGWRNGYGNIIEVRHAGDRMTVYAHLSRIDVKVGQHVEQGQHIGAVGATGWATGPHLHFEFRVHGVHQDPLAIAKASQTQVLDEASRASFGLALKTAQVRLDIAETLPGRRAAVE